MDIGSDTPSELATNSSAASVPDKRIAAVERVESAARMLSNWRPWNMTSNSAK